MLFQPFVMSVTNSELCWTSGCNAAANARAEYGKLVERHEAAAMRMLMT